jgi:hypothetical protein
MRLRTVRQLLWVEIRVGQLCARQRPLVESPAVLGALVLSANKRRWENSQIPDIAKPSTWN